ncbi:MAG: GcrA cell cycle regulator [Enterovirga sp.]|nr:GcrA cell cycle regulator [Enterovirga sp.]
MDAATGWTDDRVEMLSKLWGEGLSASQIAAALGGGVTRNAVIGKVHRLGLSGRAKAGPGVAQRTAKPRAAGVPGAAPVAPEALRVAPRDADQFTRPALSADQRWGEETALPESERVSILDLRDSMCRWPLGDPSKPDFAFCGARAVTGLPYCGHHCRIAYQPATERRRLRA